MTILQPATPSDPFPDPGMLGPTKFHEIAGQQLASESRSMAVIWQYNSSCGGGMWLSGLPLQDGGCAQRACCLQETRSSMMTLRASNCWGQWLAQLQEDALAQQLAALLPAVSSWKHAALLQSPPSKTCSSCSSFGSDSASSSISCS